MSTLEELGRQIALEQDDLLARDVLGDVPRAPVAQRPRSPRRRLGVALALAAALAGAAVVGVRGHRAGSAPLRFAVGADARPASPGEWLSAGSSAPLQVAFSDGTRLDLAPLARARVTEVTARGASLVVESGGASFEVVHRAGAAWRVALGPFVVDVTGTRFDVAWNPETEVLDLRLREGRVLVSGCVFGEGHAVAPGETVRASCREGWIDLKGNAFGQPRSPSVPASLALGSADAAQASPMAPAAPTGRSGPVAAIAAAGPAAPSGEGAALATDTAAPAAVAAAAPESDWRELARSGRYRAAREAAEAAGFDALCASAGADELMLLGDASRLSRAPGRAEQAYLALRRRFASDRRAAVAAFTLARMAAEQGGGPARAVQWFEVYLREAPGGALARDARGRLIEARRAAGDAEGARRAATEYVALYPAGPHADLARKLLAE